MTKKSTAEISTLPRSKARMMADEERRRMIEVAAYSLAEQRGFTGGDPASDWLQAEEQINRHFVR